MSIDLQSILNKRAKMLATTDQLESYLYDNIDDIINIIESTTTEELWEKHGSLEAAMLTYCYAILVKNTCDDIIKKIKDNKI